MKHTIVFHSISLGKRLQKIIGFKSSPLRLSYTQSTALLVLESQPNITQKELASILHLEPASVVTLIDELEKQKVLRRDAAEADRRKYNISLTPKGKELSGYIKAQTQKLEDFLKSNLSPAQVEEFMAIIQKITAGLDNWQDKEILIQKSLSGKGVKDESFSTKRPLAV